MIKAMTDFSISDLNLINFKCAICGGNTIFSPSDPKSYISRSDAGTDVFKHQLTEYTVKHVNFSDLTASEEDEEHINVVIIDNEGRYVKHTNQYVNLGSSKNVQQEVSTATVSRDYRLVKDKLVSYDFLDYFSITNFSLNIIYECINKIGIDSARLTAREKTRIDENRELFTKELTTTHLLIINRIFLILKLTDDIYVLLLLRSEKDPRADDYLKTIADDIIYLTKSSTYFTKMYPTPEEIEEVHSLYKIHVMREFFSEHFFIDYKLKVNKGELLVEKLKRGERLTDEDLSWEMEPEARYSFLSNKDFLALKKLDLTAMLSAMSLYHNNAELFDDIDRDMERSVLKRFITDIPEEISIFSNLEELIINEQIRLQKLPDCLGNFKKLKTIIIKNCPAIRNFNLLAEIPSLEFVSLVNNNIISVNDRFAKFFDGIVDTNHIYKLPQSSAFYKSYPIFEVFMHDDYISDLMFEDTDTPTFTEEDIIVIQGKIKRDKNSDRKRPEISNNNKPKSFCEICYHEISQEDIEATIYLKGTKYAGTEDDEILKLPGQQETIISRYCISCINDIDNNKLRKNERKEREQEIQNPSNNGDLLLLMLAGSLLVLVILLYYMYYVY